MKLLCDENIGTRVPYALNLVDLDAVSSHQAHLLGATDVEWLKVVAKKKYLAFSCNKDMLYIPEERDAIIAEKVGIIFLTSGQEQLANTLRLLLSKWKWFETIDMLVPRPFVYYLYPTGQSRKIL
jgi:hypothetical protein